MLWNTAEVPVLGQLGSEGIPCSVTRSLPVFSSRQCFIRIKPLLLYSHTELCHLSLQRSHTALQKEITSFSVGQTHHRYGIHTVSICICHFPVTLSLGFPRALPCWKLFYDVDSGRLAWVMGPCSKAMGQLPHAFFLPECLSLVLNLFCAFRLRFTPLATLVVRPFDSD